MFAPVAERLVMFAVVISTDCIVPVWMFADWMFAILRVVVPVATRSLVVILFDVSVSIIADVALRRVTISSSNIPFTAVIRFVVILVMVAVTDVRLEMEPVWDVRLEMEPVVPESVSVTMPLAVMY
jgi:hypothetical protein